MHLYHCIFIGAWVLSMCSPKPASNDAISSQSYDQGDVSLSFKHNLIHIYTTSKPNEYCNQNLNNKYQNKGLLPKPQLVNNQKMQFAPLSTEQHLSPQQEIEEAEINTEVTASVNDNESNVETDSQQRPGQKRNLFPHVSVTVPSDIRIWKYVPGYHIDLQAVYNKLLQSGFYASNPNFLVKKKQVNVNYLQPQSTVQNTKKYNRKMFPEDGRIEKLPFFYIKAPKVDLNIARAQHIARSVHKASVDLSSSFRKLPSLPQEFFSNPQILQPQKTQLYPVQNNNVYIAHHTL